MPKPKPQLKKLPGKNPTDPMQLARLVVEAATGESLPTAKRHKPSKKPKKKQDG